jgi:hypothetical protein
MFPNELPTKGKVVLSEYGLPVEHDSTAADAALLVEQPIPA